MNWNGEKERKERFRKQADISRKPEKMDDPSDDDDTFAKDELLSKMDVRLANMSYYFGHTEKLLDDIAEVQHVYKMQILFTMFLSLTRH